PTFFPVLSPTRQIPPPKNSPPIMMSASNPSASSAFNPAIPSNIASSRQRPTRHSLPTSGSTIPSTARASFHERFFNSKYPRLYNYNLGSIPTPHRRPHQAKERATIPN